MKKRKYHLPNAIGIAAICIFCNEVLDAKGEGPSSLQINSAQTRIMQSGEADAEKTGKLLKLLSAVAESFDSEYDIDAEIDLRRREQFRKRGGPENPKAFVPFAESARWTPTNELQIAIWSVIERLAQTASRCDTSVCDSLPSGASLPAELAKAVQYELGFCRITNCLDSFADKSGSKVFYDVRDSLLPIAISSAALKLRLVRQATSLPILWDEDFDDEIKLISVKVTDDESGYAYMCKSSVSEFNENVRAEALQYLDNRQISISNQVSFARLAKAAGDYQRCMERIDELARKRRLKTGKEQTEIPDEIEIARERHWRQFNNNRFHCTSYIESFGHLGIINDGKAARRAFIGEMVRLAGMDMEDAKRLDRRYESRIAEAHGRPDEYEVAREKELRAKAESRMRMAKEEELARKKKPTFEFVPCVPTPELRKELDRYGLTAGYFDYRTEETTNRIGYLLYTPKGKGLSGKKVPLVAYIPGSGEVGPDLSKLFHHRKIFDLLTSEEFQLRRPCYFMAISPPDAKNSIYGREADGSPNDLQAAIGGAIRGVARTRASPAVNESRIYLTGFSFGGFAAYALTSALPDLFAATVPVAAPPFSTHIIPENHPCNIYHLYNEGDYRKWGGDPSLLETFGKRVRELGGDFRVGTYPVEGHNAWDAAWDEEAVWDWMFSKSRGVRPTSTSARPARRPISATCTASKPARDGRSGPERACDGLDGTTYVSAEPMGKGDWFQAEFAEPVMGRVSVRTGEAGKSKDKVPGLVKGVVETSPDGRTWTRSARFGKDSGGECSFVLRTRARFIRILPESSPPQPLAVREIGVER